MSKTRCECCGALRWCSEYAGRFVCGCSRCLSWALDNGR